MEENIEILKSEGKKYTETQFIQLMTLVNRKNMVKVEFEKNIFNSKESLNLFFNKVKKHNEESKEEKKEKSNDEFNKLLSILEKYNNHSNFMSDSEKKNENFKLQQLLDEKIMQKIEKLKDFFISYEIEDSDKGKKKYIKFHEYLFRLEFSWGR